MWRIGFGFEKIGLAAQRWPVFFSLLLVALLAIASVSVRNLHFDGSVISVLPDQSKAFQDYYKLKRGYRNFSRDVTILVESDRLLTASGLEDLRNLQLDISLADGVATAVTILSTPDFDPVTGELRDWFPEKFTSDEEMLGLIDRLIEKYPQAGSMFSKERKVAVIIAALTTGVQEDDGKSFIAYKKLREAALAAAPDDFKISFTGLTPIGAEILTALISDQSKLTIIGLILGTGIAFYIFKSFLAALLCAIPPALTALLSFGLFAFFETPINYLTTILPTLALILAFADGIFLYFRWQTLNSEHDDLDANLTEAITNVGPASSLTSITTALAFASFAYAQSEALKEFAYLGVGVVTLAFIAVIIGLPLAIHWSIRIGLAKPRQAQKPMFQSVGRWAVRIALSAPAKISLAGLAIVIGLGLLQQHITAEYKLTQYLPFDSEIRYGEELANDVIGGRALLLMSVPFAKKGAFGNEENQKRLKDVEAIVSKQFGANRVFSANRILQSVNNDDARRKITELAENAPDDAKSDFLSNSGDGALITVRLLSSMPVAEVVKQTKILRESLSKLSFGNEVLVTGFPILMSIEFANLINQLRFSLIIAICLGILIIGFATRSPLITLAAITPNLLPVFFVFGILYLRGGTINLSEVVALTVAFGIAVDNAVHLINVYDAQSRAGKEDRHALISALQEVGPALTAGTVIICVSIMVTFISSLPVVPELGYLMILVLLVALISNILILPANILTLNRLMSFFNRSK